MASVYNGKNQLIQTSQEFLDDETFVGFQSVSIIMFDVMEAPALIRVTPQAI